MKPKNVQQLNVIWTHWHELGWFSIVCGRGWKILFLGEINKKWDR